METNTTKNVDNDLSSNDTLYNRFVLFELVGEIFALPLTYIQEVMDVTEYREIPRSSKKIGGIINLRGDLVVLINIFETIFPNQNYSHKKHEFDLLKTIILDINSEKIGFFVDEILDIVGINQFRFDQIPDIIPTKVSLEYIDKIGIYNEYPIIFLDLPYLFETSFGLMLESHEFSEKDSEIMELKQENNNNQSVKIKERINSRKQSRKVSQSKKKSKKSSQKKTSLKNSTPKLIESPEGSNNHHQDEISTSTESDNSAISDESFKHVQSQMEYQISEADQKELNISTEDLDMFRELGNIGAGNAGNALSQMLNKKVYLEIPPAKILTINELVKNFFDNNKNYLGYLGETKGFLEANVLLLFSAEYIENLLQKIMESDVKRHFKSEKDISAQEKSAIIEILNILIGHYIAAVSDFLKVLTDPPEYQFFFKKGKDLFLDFGDKKEELRAIFIETVINVADVPTVKGQFIMLVHPKLVKKIIDRINEIW